VGKLIRYVGNRMDLFQVRAGKGGRRYEIDGASGDPFEVEEADWRLFPRQFFEVVEPPDPMKVEARAEPPRRSVRIDPADGISDAEAAAAEGALRQYRRERLGEKLDRIAAVDSTDPDDYMEAARDDDEDADVP